METYLMTLPDERYRAVRMAEELLISLCNSKSTPGVPKIIRDRARSVLRHFPNSWDMQRAASAAPDVFQERMEDLHKFLLRGKEIKDEIKN